MAADSLSDRMKEEVLAKNPARLKDARKEKQKNKSNVVLSDFSEK